MTDFDKKQQKTQKSIENIWSYQKKAVLLHPLLKKGGVRIHDWSISSTE